jgi:hypothetical protein
MVYGGVIAAEVLCPGKRWGLSANKCGRVRQGSFQVGIAKGRYCHLYLKQHFWLQILSLITISAKTEIPMYVHRLSSSSYVSPRVFWAIKPRTMQCTYTYGLA